MSLEDTTVKMIEETFKDERCCVCSKPAKRFSRNKFYCHDCFPKKQKHVEIKKLRTPRL